MILNKNPIYKRLNNLVEIIHMVKLSEINLGSALLSTFILIGFIATAFVFIRLTIIGINYVKINYSKKEGEVRGEKEHKSESKGF